MACTDEVYRLQRGEDPDCKYFQKIAEQGHYKGRKGQSQQGIYVCSADGTFLASINSNSADAVLKTLGKGLNEFAKLSEKSRSKFANDLVKANFRWERYFPKNGIALAVYSRDLPEDLEPSSKRNSRWNRDSAWYHESEIKDLISKGLEVGDQFPMPTLLAERLLRMNLVDTVRGQTDPFSKDEVSAAIQCTVTAVSDSTVMFSMAGETNSDSNSTSFRRTPRGIVTRVHGGATWSYTDSCFADFELVAIGYRWGRTRFNGRGRGPNSNPLGFVAKLAPKDEPPNVPGLIYAYGKAWFGAARSTDGSKRK